ncbi:MAG: acyltransferase [Solirubrobacteraceae bacterium]|jgi:acetyltransferase-like isoleucine patch superfamily enzyme
MSLEPDPRALALLVGEDVTVAATVLLGAGVTIHAGTSIGEGCVIEDGVVLGKRPRLSPHSNASRSALSGLVLGERVTVCAGAIVFAGAVLGDGVTLGDQCFIRERARIGAGAVIGRGSVVEPDVAVGARARIQTNVYLTSGTLLEDDVFVGPGVITTNDDTMARHDAGYELRGATLRRACRIGGGAVLVPGVEVGEEAYVAAGAVVTRDVPARAVVMGVPARVVGEVGDADLLELWR